MNISKSKLMVIVPIAAIIVAATSAYAAFGSNLDINVLSASKNAELIKEEKVQLDKLLKDEYPKHGKTYSPSAEAKTGPTVDVTDGSFVDSDKTKKEID
ncbi:hypothetical protein [Paenibacillus kobensis]|uniref:hypothetical protein n=1 Tax=Paenibacillus kobensis TaxID=59841 RepID=UPI000FD95B25|nr:hypothetical protein [Paenibacillus kobensis]